MSARIVLGTQWGDEGKGKVVDILCEESDMVVRYQGGANAGHTVVINNDKFILHLIPTGILHSDKICVIGNGVVLDLDQLFLELDELKNKGVDTIGRLFISDSAHLVMPYHKLIEELNEERKGEQKIGTTKKGIGPAYLDKIGRVGIRVADLLDDDLFDRKLKLNFELKKSWLVKLSYNQLKDLETESKGLSRLKGRLLPIVVDSSVYLNDAIKKGKRILFESAQGTLLDIDFGTYPYATPSHTSAGGACIGSGVGPTFIDEVIGVVKAYTTRVGNGPFPTELREGIGEMLQKKGDEFGATTGRPRRCGWLDLVMLKRSVRINGIGKLVITKLDVLDEFETIPVCVGYKYKGKSLDEFPNDLNRLNNCKPVYKELPGWKESTRGLTNYNDLPEKAKSYLDFIEKGLNVPVFMISTGSKREETIIV